MLTPIERNIWNEIRFYQLPFYPQYPVGKYFVDFADPIKKIVIEVDGKYHAFTKLADEHRQRRIERLGWTVLRIKGRDTFTRTHDFFSYLSETYYDPL
jgi:very-short-patch-repair endonuclease